MEFTYEELDLLTDILNDHALKLTQADVDAKRDHFNNETTELTWSLYNRFSDIMDRTPKETN